MLKKMFFAVLMAMIATIGITNAQSAPTPKGVPDGAIYQYTLALKSVNGCSYDVYVVGDQVYHVCRKTVDGRGEVFDSVSLSKPAPYLGKESLVYYPELERQTQGVIIIIIPDNDPRWSVQPSGPWMGRP